MTTLSTHVLDVERGVPGAGVPISLFHDDTLLAAGTTDADGRLGDVAGQLEAGIYRLVFDAAAYFASQSRPAPFLQRVSIEYAVTAANSHYHVPLLLSAYACSSYRGS